MIGFPRVMQFDDSKEFVSDVMMSVTETMGVQTPVCHTLSSSWKRSRRGSCQYGIQHYPQRGERLERLMGEACSHGAAGHEYKNCCIAQLISILFIFCSMLYIVIFCPLQHFLFINA
jgi:hypothetical protein